MLNVNFFITLGITSSSDTTWRTCIWCATSKTSIQQALLSLSSFTPPSFPPSDRELKHFF